MEQAYEDLDFPISIDTDRLKSILKAIKANFGFDVYTRLKIEERASYCEEESELQNITSYDGMITLSPPNEETIYFSVYSDENISVERDGDDYTHFFHKIRFYSTDPSRKIYEVSGLESKFMPIPFSKSKKEALEEILGFILSDLADELRTKYVGEDNTEEEDFS